MIEELRKAAEAATPGPWDTTPEDVLSSELEVTAGNNFIGICDASPYDALFIAKANPQTILRLLAVVDAARVR